MAIDYIIGALLIISALVNALALGAFWVTPGLRTTANRFVINLLIVNLVGCIILAPSLFSCGAEVCGGDGGIGNGNGINTPVPSTLSSEGYKRNEFNAKVEQLFNNSNGTDTITTDSSIGWFNESVKIDCDDNSSTTILTGNCKGINQVIVINEAKNENNNINNVFLNVPRWWGFDFTTALGALSVLLIVGDTWCAITDPLRYHTRISELKAWFLIAAIWLLSILFAIASAFRYENTVGNENIDYERNDSSENVTHSSVRMNRAINEGIPFQTDNIYNWVFSCAYFLVIILLPICMVCGMYWKIFSEARQNGLRMRQNGSSPLLQSALNLAAASAAAATQCTQSSQNNTGGLTMKIDKNLTNSSNNNNNNINNNLNSNCSSRDSGKPLLTPTHPRRYLDIPKLHPKDKNHNIVVTLSSCNEQNMRRNYSARHLVLLEQNNELPVQSGLRNVQSSPNLHKSSETHLPSPTILPLHSIHPHVPPKALSYMTSIRHRLSNASSIFKYREESRAARISILVVIMFLISYFPYGMIVLLHGHVTYFTNSSLLAITFLLIANLTSPFLFAYRNKRVRRGVLRLFGLDSKTNGRLQKRRISLRRSRNQTASQIHRKSSKASNYSMNSTKYLTPHSTGSSNRPSLTNHDRYPISKHIIAATGECTNCATVNGSKLNRGHLSVKFSFIQRMRDTSRKLGCASDSCTTGSSCNEPVDV